LEVSHVRNRVRQALESARERVRVRRERNAEAEAAFEGFLDRATAVLRQVAGVLKAEGYSFTVFTPGGSARLALDRGRDDFIEITLSTSGDRPEVVARISYTRGSRTIDEERLVKPGAVPSDIGEDEVLDFVLQAMAPWLER
jgi:hypothetical protein